MVLACASSQAQVVDSVMLNRTHQIADSILRAINGRPTISPAVAPAVTTKDTPISAPVSTPKMADPTINRKPEPIQKADPSAPASSVQFPDSNRRAKSDGSLGRVPQPVKTSGPPGTGGAPQAGQAPGAPGGMQAAMQNMRMSIGHVFGKVLDGQTKKPMSYVSVSLFTMKDSLVTGQLTEDNGDFSFTDLRLGAYNVKVTFLGYKDLISKVVLTPTKSEQDIGNLTLVVDAKQLKEVDVTGQKSTMELKVDRKVFNVGNDISARGGTGLDVMKNIPSVSIDASGNVTLRNNTPQVYVDGKPTTLTLEQIPADQIDRVEVITNPSAKFEAASSGGIINVVMKRNTKPGYNGMVNLGVATNTGYNGLAMLNLKQKKFGVNLMYTINGATNHTNGYFNSTRDSLSDAISRTDQNITSTFKRIFQVAKVGFDFYINNRNTLSISQNAVFGNFNTEDNIAISSSRSGFTTNGNQDNIQNNYFRNFTTDLNFKHTYPKEGKEYTLDIQYNHSHGGGNYLYTTKNYDPLGNILPQYPSHEFIDGGQTADMVTAQWDISLPIQNNMKIELGVRSNYKRTTSFNNVYNDTTAGGVESGRYFNNNLSNNYRIDDLVDAAYITFSHQVKGFSYQLGLRAEQVYYQGTSLLNGSASFAYQYPTDAGSIPKILFPSFNISQKWGTQHELQFNVARKSNRPNFFQIAPFIFNSTAVSEQKGNPSLQPEFINQGELNYNYAGNKVSWLTSVYGRYVQQAITSVLQDSSLAGLNSGFTITTFGNAKYSASGGWENILKIFPVKKLDITLTGNVFYTDIVGGSADLNSSNKGWSWLAKAMVSYKLPLDITIQANGTYEAPKILPQGKTTSMYYFDLSLSKDFGFVTLNFTVADVLNSRAMGSHLIETNNLNADYVTYVDQSRRRDQRYAKLGVSFRFGKMDASLFKKKRPSSPDQGGDMGF
jgi:outer membrane receptor protein involved in Fe transport